MLADLVYVLMTLGAFWALALVASLIDRSHPR